MKRFKRISAIFLALVLVLGLIPGGFLFVETYAESLTPSVGDGKTWLHAVYDANGISFDGKNDNTHPLDVALTSRIMIGAAWNVEYLFLSVNSDVEFTKLQVNGKDVLAKRVTAAADSDPGFAEYRISLLDAGISSIASGVNKVTVQIGEEEAQTLYLIFDNNNYKRLTLTTTPSKGLTISSDKYSSSGTVTATTTTYNNSSALGSLLYGSTETAMIVELDLDITTLNAKNSTGTQSSGLGYNSGMATNAAGITVQILDKYCENTQPEALHPSKTDGTLNDQITQLFKFGFFKNSSGQLMMRHYVNCSTGQNVNVSDAVDGNIYHIRVEYTYELAESETEITNETPVSAKYFINGNLITTGTDVRVTLAKNENTNKATTVGTASNGAVRVRTLAGCNYTEANYSVSYNTPADLADLAKAVAVQSQIAAIGANGTITLAEVTAAKAAFDALDESVQALIPNSGNIALAQAYLDAAALPNYLHAVYAEEGVGEKPVIYLSSGAKVSAAWDWDNLYLNFGTNVAKVEIGNYANSEIAGQQVVIPWSEILGTDLTSSAARIPNAVTITVGDVAWTGNLLLNEEDYRVANGVSPAYGATWDSDTASGKLNSIAKYTDANPYTHRDILYVNNSVKGWAEEILKLGAALDRTNILELDVVTEYLPASHDFDLLDARREFIHGGISIVVIDGEAYTNGNAREGMFTGLARTGNILYFVYWNGESYVEVPVDTYQSGKEYHLRLEFTYPEDDGNGNVNNDIVNAKYFVNGKLVAEDEDVKRINGEVIGEKTYNVTIATSGDGTGTHGFFVMATDLTNSTNNSSDYTRVEATVKNVSVSNGQETILNDKAAAEAVDALINAIGTVTFNSKSAIDAAEAAYAALTEAQQALVANYATLTAAKTAYNDLKAPVDAVIAQIDALGTITLASKNAIEAAETAYAELTAEQQEQVSNYATLTDARATYDEMKANADKQEEDQAAAQVVIDQIAALGNISLESEAAIVAAETAYAALTGDQQMLVSNYATLTDARATYNALKAAADKLADDQAAAQTVIDQIAALGTISLESEAAIQTVENAYAALTEDQKNLVSNYTTLTDARATYNALKAAADKLAEDQAAAQVVIDKITALGTITLESKSAIDAAEAAYAALTEDQQALVSNYTTLTDARATYDELKAAADQAAIDQAAANGMMELIDNIGTVTLESKAVIESAEAAYEALTSEQKNLVTNYATLTAARAAYDQLVAEKKAADQAAANAVISQIEAIGTVTLDSEEAIEAAEAAYAALTDEQKALVTNYAALTAAKAAYDQLVAEKEAAEKEAADKAAADAAIAKIEAIGTVTLDSKLSIEAARVAYNSLTDEQKALVSAEVLLKLTNAETALKALETPDEPPKTGDTTMLMPVALLLTLSFVGLAVVMIGKKRFF